MSQGQILCSRSFHSNRGQGMSTHHFLSGFLIRSSQVRVEDPGLPPGKREMEGGRVAVLV